MDINLPEVLEKDLWRNKLIELYQRYWVELQNLSIFQFVHKTLLAQKLGEIATKIHTSSEESYISNTPHVKTVKKFQKEVNLLEKELGEIDERFDTASDSKQESENSEFKSVIQVLGILKKEIENMKIQIIHNSNNTLDFIDTETKIILKTKNANE